MSWGRWNRASKAHVTPDELAKKFGLSSEMAQRAYEEMCAYTYYVNKVYEVGVKTEKSGLTHLSIKRLDREPIRDWPDLQRIKNELTDPEREAVEIFPAETRRVDQANQYHLWVLPEGDKIPFGFAERMVGDSEAASRVGAKQRS